MAKIEEEACIKNDKFTQEEQPLSSGQLALWFIQKNSPRNTNYNLSFGFKLTGNLDTKRLEAALNEIIGRHGMLRGKIVCHDETPVMRINEPDYFMVNSIDISSWRKKEISDYIDDLCETHFRLDGNELWLIRLLSISPTEHILLAVFHHIIFDGWSLWLFFNDLEKSYLGSNADRRGIPETYASHVVNQRLIIESEKEKHLEYWRRRLPNGIPGLNLPTSGNGLCNPTIPPEGYVEKVIPEYLEKRMRAVCKTRKTSAFRLLLTAYMALLHRYCGDGEIAVGVATSARGAGRHHEVIGYFSNLAAIVVDFSDNPTADQVLGRVAERVAEAKQHENYPFSELIKEIKFDRTTSSTETPFKATLSYQRSQYAQDLANLFSTLLPQSAEWAGLAAESMNVRFQKPISDIDLQIVETDGKFLLTFKFRTHALSREFVENMARHFEILLRGMMAEPETRVGGLPLLTEQEMRRIVVEWNDTRAPYPGQKCFHQLFEERAAAIPDTPALIHEGQRLTYRELNEKANVLANHLLDRGVVPDTPVGLCTQRSLDMIVGVIGIMKAGGAYVPLDTSYPTERIQRIVTDANIVHCVTQAPVFDRLDRAALSGLHPILIDTGFTSAPNTANPDPKRIGLAPHHLAYILYTSGSTGQPKGVMVRHDAVVNLLLSLAKILEVEKLAEPCQALLNASLSFDASVQQFLHLAQGGTLHLIAEELRRKPARFLDYLRSRAIQCLDITPSLLQLLLAESRGEPLSTRPINILVGGEAIGREFWQELAHLQGSRCFNVYGPTECTVDTTCVEITPDRHTPILGRPLPNVQCHILDANGQPVPACIVGELHVAGDGLARGYLNKPELTAKQFIDNPLRPGTRAYKTGDLARYLPDGTIEFLGRADFQVKIRGFRIEMGEIESQLLQRADIREAVVTTRGEGAAAQLAAYVVPAEHAESDEARLIRILADYLRSRLPSYMVPAFFVVLQSMPLTSSGKVDRRALPPPSPNAGDPDRKNRVAPNTDTEILLCKVWENLLGMQGIGTTDNFFDLGGHSILVMRMISQLHKLTSVELEFSDVFGKPTLAGLAALIESARKRQDTSLPLSSAPRNIPLPISTGEKFMIANYGWKPWILFNAFRLDGALNTQALIRSLNEIVARHEILRTSYLPDHGEIRRRIEPADRFQVKIVNLSSAGSDGASWNTDEERQQEQLINEFRKEFHLCDLTRGPLFQARIFLLAETSAVLLLTAPHVIYDNKTWDILTSEIFSLYEGHASGNRSDLEPPPLQYADYAYWEHRWLQLKERKEEIQFHIDRLADLPIPSGFPENRREKKQEKPLVTIAPIHIGGAALAKFKRFKRRAGKTSYTILLALFKALIAHRCNHCDFAVITPLSSRNKSHTDDMPGVFIADIVVRSKIDLNDDLLTLIGKVNENFVEACSHMGTPIGLLIDEINRRYPKNLSPLGIYVNIHPDISRNNSVPGLSIAQVPLPPSLLSDQLAKDDEVADADLNLYLHETENGIDGALYYDAHLFGGPFIEALVSGLVELLESGLDDPYRPMREVLSNLEESAPPSR